MCTGSITGRGGTAADSRGCEEALFGPLRGHGIASRIKVRALLSAWFCRISRCVCWFLFIAFSSILLIRKGRSALEAETQEFIKHLLRFGAVFFFIGAATLDIYYLFRFSHRDSRPDFPGVDDLRNRPITLPAVILTLFTALLFTVPNQIVRSGTENLPTLPGMTYGALIYMCAALLLVVFTTAHARTPVSAMFHSSKTTLPVALKKGVLYGIAAIPPTMIITVITNELIMRAGYQTESQPVIQWLTNPDTSPAARITIFVSAVVVAPLAEELIFRGVLFPAVLKRKSWFFAAMLTGCIFSLIHFHPPSFLSIFMLSLFFCAGYSTTGSLLTPIVMHMVFNASATFFTLLI